MYMYLYSCVCVLVNIVLYWFHWKKVFFVHKSKNTETPWVAILMNIFIALQHTIDFWLKEYYIYTDVATYHRGYNQGQYNDNH